MDPNRRRDQYLRRTYAISLEEYNLILELQGGVCYGCGFEPKARALHVDHDHKSLQVRGLLCWRCNSVLGKARDDPEVLEYLAGFLRFPPAVEALGEPRYVPKNRPRRRRRRKK